MGFRTCAAALRFPSGLRSESLSVVAFIKTRQVSVGGGSRKAALVIAPSSVIGNRPVCPTLQDQPPFSQTQRWTNSMGEDQA